MPRLAPDRVVEKYRHMSTMERPEGFTSARWRESLAELLRSQQALTPAPAPRPSPPFTQRPQKKISPSALAHASRSTFIASVTRATVWRTQPRRQPDSGRTASSSIPPHLASGAPAASRGPCRRRIRVQCLEGDVKVRMPIGDRRLWRPQGLVLSPGQVHAFSTRVASALLVALLLHKGDAGGAADAITEGWTIDGRRF